MSTADSVKNPSELLLNIFQVGFTQSCCIAHLVFRKPLKILEEKKKIFKFRVFNIHEHFIFSVTDIMVVFFLCID